MRPILAKLDGTILTLLRFLAGAMFACHGAQKLLGVLGGHGHAQGKFLVAGIVELGGGTLIAIGLFASIAALIAAGEMAVAYFTAHAPGGFWPIINGGELPVLFCFIFLYISAKGAGRFSVDALLMKTAK